MLWFQCFALHFVPFLLPVGSFLLSVSGFVDVCLVFSLFVFIPSWLCPVLCHVSVFSCPHVFCLCSCFLFYFDSLLSVLSCLALLSVFSRLCWLSCPALMCFTCCITCPSFVNYLMYLASVFPLSFVRSFCVHACSVCSRALVFSPVTRVVSLCLFLCVPVSPASVFSNRFLLWVSGLCTATFCYNKSSSSTTSCLPACLALRLGPHSLLPHNSKVG